MNALHGIRFYHEDGTSSMSVYYGYGIFDRDGYEMPRHYSGRPRSYIEAKKMCDKLNKDGEYAPYTIQDINDI